MKKLACVAAVLGGALLLSACGTVKVESVRVLPGELTKYMSTPGIYYALPRTEVTVAFPVTLERQMKGFKGNIIEACVAACGTPQPRSDTDRPDECTIPTANDSIVLGRPEVGLRTMQDFNHLYRLSVDGGFLDGVKHAVAVAENGVLSETTTTVSNHSAELALGVVSQLGKFALSTTFDKADKATEANKEKLPVQVKPAGLTCKDAREIATEEAAFKKKIKDLEERRTALLVPKPGVESVLSADHLKLANERLREQIAEAEAARDRYRANQDLVEVKKTFKSRLVSQPLAPAENGALAAEKLTFQALVESESAELLALKVQDVLNNSLTMMASLSPKLPVGSTAGFHDEAKEPAVAGYRYRIPMAGVLKVTCTGSDTAPSACAPNAKRPIIDEQLPIAQYGALASLPVEFKGKSATVGLALHPSTGGIKKVDLGIEPVGAKPVLDTIDSLRSSHEERRKREVAEAEKELDAEKSQLTREREVLKLKKEIRDLQKELGTMP